MPLCWGEWGAVVVDGGALVVVVKVVLVVVMDPETPTQT
jgi:hypothetical protein